MDFSLDLLDNEVVRSLSGFNFFQPWYWHCRPSKAILPGVISSVVLWNPPRLDPELTAEQIDQLRFRQIGPVGNRRDFRKRYQRALEEIFIQVLRLSQEAGLRKGGRSPSEKATELANKEGIRS